MCKGGGGGGLETFPKPPYKLNLLVSWLEQGAHYEYITSLVAVNHFNLYSVLSHG